MLRLLFAFDVRAHGLLIAAVLDIRIVREQPDFVKSRLALRCGGDEEKIDELLRVDAERRKAETALQGLNAERKKLSKEIGGMRSRGQDSPELENRVRKIGEDIARLNEDVNLVDGQQKKCSWRFLICRISKCRSGRTPAPIQWCVRGERNRTSTLHWITSPLERTSSCLISNALQN